MVSPNTYWEHLTKATIIKFKKIAIAAVYGLILLIRLSSVHRNNIKKQKI